MQPISDSPSISLSLSLAPLFFPQLLTELAVSDDQTLPAAVCAGAKFKRCFGVLLLRDSKVERCGLRALH